MNPTRLLTITFLFSALFQLSAQSLVNRIWERKYCQPVDTVQWGSSCTFDTLGYVITVGSTVTGDHSSIVTTRFSKTGDTSWRRLWTSDNTKNMFGVKVVNDGDNTIVLGAAQNEYSGFDMVLLKYSSDGNLVWQTQFRDGENKYNYPVDITLGDGGDIYLVGTTISNTHKEDILTVKFSGSDLQWKRTYNYNNHSDYATAVSVKAGYVFVSGGISSATDNRECAILRYTANDGTLTSSWMESTTSNSLDIFTGIKADGGTGIYATGLVSDDGTHFRVRTSRFDTALSQQWSQDYLGDTLYCEPRGITLDTKGNVLVTGRMDNKNMRQDIFALKYRQNNGQLVWDNIIHSSNYTDSTEAGVIQTDSSGEAFICGNTFNGSLRNFFIMNLDSLGHIGWVKSLPLASNQFAHATDLKVNDIGDIYVTGTFNDNGTLRYITLRYQNLHRVRSYYYDSLNVPRYVKDELIVRFSTTAFNMSKINDREISYGKPHEIFGSDSIKTFLENRLGLSLPNSQLIKVFKDLTSEDSLSVSRLGDTIRMPAFWSTFILTLPSNTNLDAASDSLSNLDTLVAYAEKNYVILLNSGANDKYYPNQASLYSSTWENGHINIPEAWDYETGKNYIKVGVMDDGISGDKIDFNDGSYHKVAGGYNNYDNKGDHGTKCAGIIGALRNNSKFIAGIAGGDMSITNQANPNYSHRYGVPLYDLKCPNSTYDEMAAALVHGAYDPSWKGQYSVSNGLGLHIINSSIGLSANQIPMALYQAVSFAYSNNTVLCASRGNGDRTTPDLEVDNYPATFLNDDWVINVGASDRDGNYKNGSNISDVGNRGLWTLYGKGMDLLAPGAYSIVNTLNPSDENVIGFNNTSAAAPHVTGVAALMLSSFNQSGREASNLAPEDVEYLVEETANRRPSSTSSYSDQYGWGLINAGKALLRIQSPSHKILHYTTTTSIGTPTKLNTSGYIATRVIINEIQAKQYYADVYKVSVTQSYSLPSGYYAINGWARGSGRNTNTYAPPPLLYDVIDPYSRYAKLTDFHNGNSNTAIIEGYVYHLVYGYSSFGSLVPTDIWLPYNPFTNPEKIHFAYTIHASTQTSEINSDYPLMTNNLYPNPTTESALLSFFIPSPGEVKIDILDLEGRMQNVVTNQNFNPGEHIIPLSFGEKAKGIYIIRMFYKTQIITKKIVIQ